MDLRPLGLLRSYLVCKLCTQCQKRLILAMDRRVIPETSRAHPLFSIGKEMMSVPLAQRDTHNRTWQSAAGYFSRCFQFRPEAFNLG